MASIPPKYAQQCPGGWDDPSHWSYDSKKPTIVLTKKCTCGTAITMGKDDHLDFHSLWCDLIKKDET
jgi:hypothetical protein